MRTISWFYIVFTLYIDSFLVTVGKTTWFLAEPLYPEEIATRSLYKRLMIPNTALDLVVSKPLLLNQGQTKDAPA
jgi:hypothetical protein